MENSLSGKRAGTHLPVGDLNLKFHHDTSRISDYHRQLDLTTKLPTIPGQVASIADFVPGCRFCQRQGVPVEELTERPPLVEISPDHFVEACPRCANL